MNDLIPFDFKGTSIRAVTDSDGEPWLVASDVATTLGYRDAYNLTRRLDEDEKGTHLVSTPGGDQDLTIINEAGLYSAVIGSKVPEARAFRRWVTHEVLPSIRRRGGYLTPEATEKALTDPDFIIRLATSLKEERERTATLTQKIEADAPKVLFADAVSTSHTSILVGDLAKLLCQNGVQVGANRLFAWLRANGFLINRRGSDWNSPTQRAQERGLFRVKETAVTHSDGHVTVNRTPKVTGKGQTYFVSRFLDGRFTLEGKVA